jgi:hypothetical protein
MSVVCIVKIISSKIILISVDGQLQEVILKWHVRIEVLNSRCYEFYCIMSYTAV